MCTYCTVYPTQPTAHSIARRLLEDARYQCLHKLSSATCRHGEAFDREREEQQCNSSRPQHEAREREDAAGLGDDGVGGRGGDGMEESGSPQQDARCGVAEEAAAEREPVVGCTASGVTDKHVQGEDGKCSHCHGALRFFAYVPLCLCGLPDSEEYRQAEGPIIVLFINARPAKSYHHASARDKRMSWKVELFFESSSLNSGH